MILHVVVFQLFSYISSSLTICPSFIIICKSIMFPWTVRFFLYFPQQIQIFKGKSTYKIET